MKKGNVLRIENSLLFYLLIVSFCMNLLGRGSIFCLAFGLFSLLLINKNLTFDRTAWVVILFAAVAAITSFYYEGAMEAIKCANYALAYIVGYNIYRLAENKDLFIRRSMFAVFFGFTLLFVIYYFFNLNYEVVEGERTIISIWTGEPIAVTLVGLLCSVAIGYFFYAMISKKLWLKIVALVAVIFSFLINLQTATRTPIILFFISIIVMTLIFLINQKRRTAAGIIFALGLVVAVSISMYSMNAFGIQTYLLETPLYKRFIVVGAETNRFAVAFDYLEIMWDYPLGGSMGAQRLGVLPHNFVQQGYDMYGIFAGLIIGIIALLFVANMVRILLIRNKCNLDYLFLSLYLTMFVQCMLEPVLTGYPALFFSLLFMHGIVNAYLKNKKETA